MKKFVYSFNFIVSIIPLILSICLIYIIIWGLNKGFDFSDEGYLMMGYTLPVHIQPTGLYQVLLNLLVNFFSPDVIFYRSLRLILIILSSSFFSYQFIAYLNQLANTKHSLTSTIFVFASILLSNLMSYSIFESNLSYNILTLCIALNISALILLFFRKRELPLKIILLFSLFCSFQFIVKFPTALVFYFLIITFIFFHYFLYKKSMLQFLGKVSIFSICFLLFTALVIQLTHGSILSYLIDLTTSISLLKDHDPNLLKSLYIESFKYSYWQSIYKLKGYSYLLGSAAIIYLSLPKSRIRQVLSTLLIFCTLIYLWLYTNRIIELELFKSGMRYLWRALDAYLPILFTIILVNFPLLFFHSYRPKNLIHLSLLFLFLGLPILCSLGTGNELTLQCLQYMFAPISVICMLYILQKDATLKSINMLILLGTCVLVFSQTKSGFIDHPYRITGKLSELSIKFTNKKLNALYTDSSTNYFLSRIENNITQRTNFKGNIPCIDFCKIPGVVYAINGYTPRNAWFSRTVSELNIYFFSSEKKRFKNCILFLPTNYESNESIMKFLDASNLNINQDFLLLDSLPHYLMNYKDYTINENIGIWSSKSNLKTTTF